MAAVWKGAVWAALAWAPLVRGAVADAQPRGGLPMDVTPTLILDFVADASDPWATLSLDFVSPEYLVDEGDPTAGNEHINIQVWS